ncbi:MAG: exodeoxyribonuclease VII large subunit [Acutalibacteraceae bacterium]
MPNNKPLTVSQLNAYIKASFDHDLNLKNLCICGEISNFKKHFPSGHLYFSLKDSVSVVRAVMFSGQASKVAFELKDGMSVIVFGRVSCYEPSGQYQIYVESIQPEGIGSVYLAFEQLKNKLLREGLFDENFKKPIPKYPKAIGVVTSKTGAVIHDIKAVVGQRYPLCEIILYPAEVQGEKAEKEIVDGIEYFNRYSKVDVIIIGRGGGSIEDLWAFNKESVARAVFSSQIPIISAVGHETDVTICDFVADKRAVTPSQAAEFAVPDINSIRILVDDLFRRISNSTKYKISEADRLIESFENAIKFFGISSQVESKVAQVENLIKRLKNICGDKVQKSLIEYEFLKRRLEACSCESTLNRGFARIISQNNQFIKLSNISENERVKIEFASGILECNLTNIVKLEKQGGKTNGEKEY